MLKDRYDSPITTTSQKARDVYVEGVDRFLGAIDGIEEAFRDAIAADEGFAMPHAGLARYLIMVGRGREAKEEIAMARMLAGGVSSREAAQIEIISDMIEGRAPLALQRIKEHVADHPRDVMVAQANTGVFGLIGFSGQAGREAEQLAYTTMLQKHYGDDWWFLCQHAFAQMEAGQIEPAATNIDRALELRPDSANSAHVRAHLYYENGAADEGFPFLKAFAKDYPATGYLHCHVNWHIALWALETGDMKSMWETFEAHVLPDRSSAPPLNIMTDSVAILYRAALAGEVVPKSRWEQVSDYAARRFPNPGLAFADVHAALAHAIAGQRERLQTIIEGAKGPAGAVVASIAKAFRCFADGDPEAVIRNLIGIVGEHERIGGSRAQRDLIEFALAQALMDAGRSEEARRLLDMRRPHTSHDHAIKGLA